MHSFCQMHLIKPVTQLSGGKVFTKIVDIPCREKKNKQTRSYNTELKPCAMGLSFLTLFFFSGHCEPCVKS